MVVNNDTKDKVFLLSIEEVTNQDYGFSSDSDEYDNARCKKLPHMQRRKEHMQIAIWRNMNIIKTVFGGSGRLTTIHMALRLSLIAVASVRGGISVANIDCAVCPALHLNLSSDVWSYAGTVCTDGTVDETPIAKARADE